MNALFPFGPVGVSGPGPRREARPLLLASVRSAGEAQVAVAGGADLIDAKEPARGALGAVDADVVSAIQIGRASCRERV